MATTGSAHRAVKCALNSHKAPLAARFVSVGVSCRCASDGNIDYYARPGMCIIELPPAINIPKFCRAHFILLIYPRRACERAGHAFARERAVTQHAPMQRESLVVARDP